MSASHQQLTPPIFSQTVVSLGALQQAGLSVEETTYLTIGGGLGSFIWVDHLLIYGADPGQIVAIGVEPKPYTRCQRLCRHSQIDDEERLRSDSGGTPDNIWGWPGYAVREIGQDVKNGRLAQAARLIWQLFSEPVLSDPFTPKAGHVFASLDREAQRIDWANLWRCGWVQAIRKTDDGRYAALYAPPDKPQPHIIVAPYVHLALGYAGPHFLPDLLIHRQETGDSHSFVNAYEPHDHIYSHLRQHGGTVLLRGRGITASRILQRLSEERSQNPHIVVLHLLRTPRPQGPQFEQTQRPTHNHFDHQHYNFPKSAFGGDLHFVLAQATPQERAALVDLWGGTTTAKRRAWEEIIARGLREGWYQVRFGHLARLKPGNGRLSVHIIGTGSLREETQLPVDFIIDATGLDAQPECNPLLQELLQTYRLWRNCTGQLAVTDQFEIAALGNGNGRLYASGIITLGGPYAPVDSFTGLQYAAQQAMASLIAAEAPGLRPLTPWRSLQQWWRWATGAKP